MNYVDVEERLGANFYRSIPVVLEQGEGSTLFDVHGKTYIDAMSAFSAVNFGHAHPRLVKAMVEQASNLTMVSRAYRHNQMAPALEALHRVFGYEKAAFLNTGAEAVEMAVKLMRRWGYKHKGIPENRACIIAMEGNFHGRTLAPTSLSSKAAYKENFGPLLPGIKWVPFGDTEALENVMDETVCGVLLEPIQGERGVVLPPHGWFKAVRDICNKHNALMVVDEIQAGMGRAGYHMFHTCSDAPSLGDDHGSVRADVVLLAKSLSGGMLPVSAVLADDRVMHVMQLGSHGSTFGGNPLACRMVCEALTLLESENLCERSLRLGQVLLSDLRALNMPKIHEIRGSGLWVALDFDKNIPDIASWVRGKVLELVDEGVLTSDTQGHIIRLAPPLIIKQSELDFITDKIRKVFT